MKTKLSSTIAVNPESSLEREWIAVHDPGLPVVLAGTPGIKTVYRREDEYSNGGYVYETRFSITPQEALSALSVRFLLFDVWGEHIRTLASTDVMDLAAGDEREFTPTWELWSENECSEFYASIAYVARVRTQAGSVKDGDTQFVLEQARRFSAKFAVTDLEPQKRPQGK